MMIMRAPFPLLAILALSACVPLERTGASSGSARPIVISEDSNVCVSVHVDQQIWPRPIDEDLSRNLSGSLAADLRRLYLAQGGSYAVSNSQPAERFVTNDDGATPSCHDRETDVLVELTYGPRPNGEPFVLDYRVSRGPARHAALVDVNVAEEIRAGRIRGYDQRRTDAIITGEDLVRRAPSLFELLQIAE